MMKAPLPVRNPKSNTHHHKNQQSVIMQLRSGTVISRPPTVSVPANVVIGRVNIRDPTYNPSKIELAKIKVREQVRERQRKMADKHSNKAVDQAIGVFENFIEAANDTHNSNGDTLMEKIRIITLMYTYANSLSTYTMMNSRIMRLRSTMIKQCKNFSKDATNQINGRIKEVKETKSDREAKCLTNYYIFNLNMLLSELDQFTNTYANRL